MSRSALRVVVWIAGFAALGLLMFAHFYLDVLARGGTEPVGIKLVEELTASLGAGVCFVLPVWVMGRGRKAGWSRPRTLAAYVLLLPVFSILHTSWNWGTRSLVFPLLGLGRYDYGRMPLRYAMEFPTDVVFYAFVMSILYLFHRYQESQERALRLARVESELARVRLEVLEGQLRPHFLFNVLNTVSSVMYEDVAAADAMLARLADLLRRTLRRSPDAGGEVSLDEELETLDLYLAIMRARFAERLHVDVQVDDEVRRAQLPALVLQPLVENAIVHGDPGPGATARIAVRARREDGRLIVEVEDNGPGLPGPTVNEGIGLSTTSRRLTALYGAAASVKLEGLLPHGARAVVTLPYTVAS